MKSEIITLSTILTRKFGLKLPIIQAPMAGGISTPALVATVSNEGGLGSLPLGYLNSEQAKANIVETKKLTSKPFAVNAFIPQSKVFPRVNNLEKMHKKIAEYQASLGLEKNLANALPSEAAIEDLIEITINEKIPVFSFTFGMLSKKNMQRLKKNNIFVIGTATTVAEGLLLEKSGCDAVIGQGYEAGGHRGTFLHDFKVSQIGTLPLIRQLAVNLKIPVIAAGGIMDGSGIVSALSLGASAVQMGTAFLTCKESDCGALYRKTVLASTEESTAITAVFTGKPARGIINRFMKDMEQAFSNDEIPAYPTQHYLTQKLRKESVKKNSGDFPSFWLGQGSRLNRDTTVKILFSEIENEITRTLETLNSQANLKIV